MLFVVVLLMARNVFLINISPSVFACSF